MAPLLRWVRVVPACVKILPRFDFAEKLADLSAEQPSWPPRTEDLAEISIELELRRASGLGQRLAGNRRIRLDILGYPGEWLLDLPLLGQSFPEWSHLTLARLRPPPRRGLAQAFLDFHDNVVSPNDPADDAILRRGHRLYRDTIQACRFQLGLRYLQPGRFLCPGPLLTDRFEAYKREIRDSIFDSHFGSFSRQIVLVDVLGACMPARPRSKTPATRLPTSPVACEMAGVSGAAGAGKPCPGIWVKGPRSPSR